MPVGSGVQPVRSCLPLEKTLSATRTTKRLRQPVGDVPFLTTATILHYPLYTLELLLSYQRQLMRLADCRVESICSGPSFVLCERFSREQRESSRTQSNVALEQEKRSENRGGPYGFNQRTSFRRKQRGSLLLQVPFTNVRKRQQIWRRTYRNRCEKEGAVTKNLLT